jgi:hypothetical protein
VGKALLKMKWHHAVVCDDIRQPSERNQTAFFSSLMFYWRSPESGEMWFKSGRLSWIGAGGESVAAGEMA